MWFIHRKMELRYWMETWKYKFKLVEWKAFVDYMGIKGADSRDKFITEFCGFRSCLDVWEAHRLERVLIGLSFSWWIINLFPYLNRFLRKNLWGSRILVFGCVMTPVVELTTCTGNTVTWQWLVQLLLAVSVKFVVVKSNVVGK